MKLNPFMPCAVIIILILVIFVTSKTGMYDGWFPDVAGASPDSGSAERESLFLPSGPPPTLAMRLAPAASVTRLMRVTAYCPCPECCREFSDGITASGLPVTYNGGFFVAAPPEIPFGTMIRIPGYNNGEPVPVLDRGSAITGDRLDVFFPTHEQALEWGWWWMSVEITPQIMVAALEN